jgi:Ca2+-binding RTX toxin-like protein
MHVYFDSAPQTAVTLTPLTTGAGFVLSDGVHTTTVGDRDLNIIGDLIIDFPGFDDNFTMSGSFAAEDLPDSLTVHGGAGSDTIDLSGATGLVSIDIALFGDNGGDIIIGSSVGDVINGGEGFDTLTGGAGNDIFVFADFPAIDTVLDFTAGTDLLDLDALLSPFFDENNPGLEITTQANGSTGTTVLVNAAPVVNLDGIFAGATLDIIYDTANQLTVQITATA